MFQSKISIALLFILTLFSAQAMAAAKIYDCEYSVKYLSHSKSKLLKIEVLGLRAELGNIKCQRKKGEELIIAKDKIFGEKVKLIPNKTYLVRILKYRGKSASGLTAGERYFFSRNR